MADSQQQPSESAPPHGSEHIALIGVGAIGISFLALHLTYTAARVSVFDPRPDLKEHVAAILPLYLPSTSQSSGSPESSGISVEQLTASGRLRFCSTLREAVQHATIVQEQGPEHLPFKQRTWSEVLRYVSAETHLWSSTSGIPASQQLAHLTTSTSSQGDVGTTTTAAASNSDLSDETIASARSRLLIVHPFNPPHLMPLLELVPSPHTSPAATGFAKTYFGSLGSIHRPITIHKETPGFVANRLSFILFREACQLVASGVCTARDLDEIVRASLGPRWAVAGPFQMYNFGGGARGMRGFLDNIGEAIDAVWSDDAEKVSMRDDDNSGWKDVVVEQTATAYGMPSAEDIRRRDRGLKAVVGVQEELEREQEQE
ncbi:hypothetical protein AYO21_04228 [Fonsecaea monophora]|uniref:3-hydroxyacyl-CoA dehydrogenase NAD binding domain-containing protein n=1 Tax=Fonsecaea monophora TaxID=254056 RepID=A0A177FCL7_9EURO|nr:hypothetical protein AYO21_04228 [Fonsecaea monophora]KAH0834329.1 putative 3-hydroxyacyl-CoA dehydrogenase, NAD binding domain [Fonsecaea pedrosoi]OAG41526.1 hypothetical protein AYO21_04228 [Fonsecaea monophora]